MVVDHNTGLQWQQTTPAGLFSLDEAINYCADLTYGGYNDWRLPAQNELFTIADNRSGSVLYEEYFTSYGYFLGSILSGYSWIIAYNGDTNITTMDGGHVRCVRGESLPTGLFTSSVKNGDGIVTDSSTGLMWQQTYIENKTWRQSLLYCENLTYAGYSDWRLPNRNELASLLDYTLRYPSSDFPGMPRYDTSWSSSSYAGVPWWVSPGYGYIYNRHANDEFYVHCVRSDNCDENYFWNGSMCVENPCQTNSCNVSHATGNCQPITKTLYSCDCEKDYFWNGSKCTSPCEPNLCLNDAHSDGVCTTINSDIYSCGCANGYSWTGNECKKFETGLSIGNICTGNNCYGYNGYYIQWQSSCPALGEDYFGQDANYSNSGSCVTQNFTLDYSVENGSLVIIVIDNNTGLGWQKMNSTNEYTWEEAYAYCETLNYGGYSDWRLPEPLELFSITAKNRSSFSSIMIDVENHPSSYDAYLWTSKTSLNDGSKALALSYNFDHAYSGIFEELLKEKSYNVICTRGKRQPSASFTTSIMNNDEIVTDSTTGLTWQRNYTYMENLKDALAYCEGLSYAGHTDWRLPNINELVSLVSFEKYSPASDFPDMPSGIFLSSSFYDRAPWSLDFSNGFMQIEEYHNYLVRCVRSDICDGENYIWNGFACINPCDPNQCINDEYSNGTCNIVNDETYYCNCVDGYSWNAGSCKKYSTGSTLGNICTGQRECYNNSTIIECPAPGEDFFGQDPQYAVLGACTQQYLSIDSDINIDVDHNTGLQWQRWNSGIEYTWNEAWAYCENLDYAGYSDWRLPNPQELFSIIDINSGTMDIYQHIENMPPVHNDSYL